MTSMRPCAAAGGSPQRRAAMPAAPHGRDEVAPKPQSLGSSQALRELRAQPLGVCRRERPEEPPALLAGCAPAPLARVAEHVVSNSARQAARVAAGIARRFSSRHHAAPSKPAERADARGADRRATSSSPAELKRLERLDVMPPQRRDVERISRARARRSAPPRAPRESVGKRAKSGACSRTRLIGAPVGAKSSGPM